MISIGFFALMWEFQSFFITLLEQVIEDDVFYSSEAGFCMGDFE